MPWRQRIAALLALVPILLLAQPAPKSPIEKLGWLAGCWASREGDTEIAEQWMSPSGGVMLGMSRTVSKGKTVEFEFLQIREDGKGGLVFVARPSGQAEASFPAVKMGERQIVFESPAHDFPQRITYRSPGRDSLVARVESLKGDQGLDFKYHRVACP
jgi:hypothetical protein